MHHAIRPVAATLVAFAISVAPPAVATSASDLATKAERLIDQGPADPKRLEEAEGLLQQALQQDPASTRAIAQGARLVLMRGTEDEGVRPSALTKASGMLMRA